LGRIRVGLVFGVLVLLVFVAVFGVVLNVSFVKGNSGTIYIRADGSIDPPDAPISTFDNVTYTLTDNITGFTSSVYGIIVERDNIIIDGDGYTVQGPGGSSIGINLHTRSNVTIKNMEIKAFTWCIGLSHSSNNSIVGNNIANNYCGITLGDSSNNSISGNNITANILDGIYLVESSNNTISGNTITNSCCGITLLDSSNNSISGNNITANNPYGTSVSGGSYNNTISSNMIINNLVGIYLSHLPIDNRIYHNNIINNTHQAIGPTVFCDIWDDGYPSGGNYWSDYTGVDEKNGPNQDQLGSDGIGDTPYVIDSNDKDRYPLMNPWAAPFPVAKFTYTPSYPSINKTVTFNASSSYDSDGTIETYTWSFGDGNTTITTDPIIIHIYTAEGIYQANLTVTDDEGLSRSITRSIPVGIDSTPPTIETPSRTAEGDVLPNQSVKVSVNVTDALSGVKNVTLSYTTNDGATWTNLPMNHNSSTSLYEATIPGQEAGTWVKFKIVAYDYAGNNATKDGTEPYCAYQVIPEFPSSLTLIPLLMITTLIAVLTHRRKQPR